MHPIVVTCAAFLFLGINFLMGNGGGYVKGGVEVTGGIVGFVPKATEKIQILDETLIIRAGSESAQVEVRYLMKNMSDEAVKVRFGFPIEETEAVSYLSNPEKAPQQQLLYCKKYQITARGKPVAVEWQAEKSAEADPRRKGLTGWNISEITFAKGEEVPVLIRFESDYSANVNFISDTLSQSAGIFRYRLSTAACWHGTIAQGRVIIEADEIEFDDIRVIKPVNRFKKEGDRWVWNFKELEPTMADDFEVECQPEERHFRSQLLPKSEKGTLPDQEYATFINRREKWSMLHANYEVKASSTLAAEGERRYDAENLRDASADMIWSEGAKGGGVGEWLELTPVAAKPLIEIRMRPGYQKVSENGVSLYFANARPKTVLVELNGEHRLTATIPDLAEQEVSIPVTGYNKAVKKIRLTFAEIYPGQQFEDMCVTSVRLNARLDKKPKIMPQR